MSKHPATELRENVQEQLKEQVHVPSTGEITQAIEKTKLAVEEEIHKRGPLATEYKVGKDMEKFLDSAKHFLEEKNRGDLIQKFVADSRSAADEMSNLYESQQFFNQRYQLLVAREQARDITSLAQSNISSIKDLVMTILNSFEFRGLINDFIEIMQHMYERTTEGVPSMKAEEPSKPLTEEYKEKGEQAIEHGKQILTEIQQGTTQIPEDKKREMKIKFKTLLKRLSDDPNYVNSIHGLFNVIDQLQFLAIRIRDQSQPQFQNLQTPSLYAMADDVKLFLINFSGPQPVDALINDSNKFWNFVVNDPELTNYFNDLRSFVMDVLQNPSIIESDQFDVRYEALYNKGNALYNDSRYTEPFRAMYRDIRILIDSIRYDRTTSQFAYDSKRIARDLFLDRYGKPSLSVMSTGLTNLRSLLGPILKRNLENVPVPGTSGEDDTYKWRIDSMTVNMSELVPDHIDFKMWGSASVSLTTTQSEAVTYLTMWIRDVSITASNLKFWFSRKVIPKLEEEGVADVSVTGRNELRVTWVIRGKQDENWLLDIHEVKCNLDNVDVTVKESTHTFLMKLLTTLFSGTIRRNIEQKIEENVRTGLLSINDQIIAALKGY